MPPYSCYFSWKFLVNYCDVLENNLHIANSTCNPRKFQKRDQNKQKIALTALVTQWKIVIDTAKYLHFSLLSFSISAHL
jgi:hypothetical protein